MSLLAHPLTLVLSVIDVRLLSLNGERKRVDVNIHLAIPGVDKLII
jgi:hypothetical protein